VINSQLTDSDKRDIDLYHKNSEVTQLDIKNVDTIQGFSELKNEKNDVSSIDNYYWYFIIMYKERF